jgi:hypothetical protein
MQPIVPKTFSFGAIVAQISRLTDLYAVQIIRSNGKKTAQKDNEYEEKGRRTDQADNNSTEKGGQEKKHRKHQA